MSNLLKVGTTISKSERIIDYNDIIKDRVEAARAASRQKADSDGFINGLNADVVERLPEDEIDTEAVASEEMTQESAEAARAEAEEILAQAKAEAEEILAQAQAQAGQIREEAKKEGFNSGTIESERQLTEKKQELEQQHAQLVKQLEEQPLHGHLIAAGFAVAQGINLPEQGGNRRINRPASVTDCSHPAAVCK